jgi:hypothetical protein
VICSFFLCLFFVYFACHFYVEIFTGKHRKKCEKKKRITEGIKEQDSKKEKARDGEEEQKIKTN